MNPSNARLARGKIGFSLIEVLLAIGLVTFALLVIFSLMPVGMAALQDTNRQIVETEIYNTLGAELVSTPFTKVGDYKDARFPVYFDNEGKEVTAANAIFTVRCVVATAELGAGELLRVTLLIGYHRDPDEIQADAPKPSKRTFLLVNRGI